MNYWFYIGIYAPRTLGLTNSENIFWDGWDAFPVYFRLGRGRCTWGSTERALERRKTHWGVQIGQLIEHLLNGFYQDGELILPRHKLNVLFKYPTRFAYAIVLLAIFYWRHDTAIANWIDNSIPRTFFVAQKHL